MKGFRSTNIQNFTKIIELFMIVYNMPIVFRKMYIRTFLPEKLWIIMEKRKTPFLLLDNGLRT